jgi:hypothetical protein
VKFGLKELQKLTQTLQIDRPANWWMIEHSSHPVNRFVPRTTNEINSHGCVILGKLAQNRSAVRVRLVCTRTELVSPVIDRLAETNRASQMMSR